MKITFVQNDKEMAEVREDSVLCSSDACLDWDDAVSAADDQETEIR